MRLFTCTRVICGEPSARLPNQLQTQISVADTGTFLTLLTCLQKVLVLHLLQVENTLFFQPTSTANNDLAVSLTYSLLATLERYALEEGLSSELRLQRLAFVAVTIRTLLPLVFYAPIEPGTIDTGHSVALFSVKTAAVVPGALAPGRLRLTDAQLSEILEERKVEAERVARIAALNSEPFVADPEAELDEQVLNYLRTPKTEVERLVDRAGFCRKALDATLTDIGGRYITCLSPRWRQLVYKELPALMYWLFLQSTAGGLVVPVAVRVSVRSPLARWVAGVARTSNRPSLWSLRKAITGFAPRRRRWWKAIRSISVVGAVLPVTVTNLWDSFLNSGSAAGPWAFKRPKRLAGVSLLRRVFAANSHITKFWSLRFTAQLDPTARRVHKTLLREKSQKYYNPRANIPKKFLGLSADKWTVALKREFDEVCPPRHERFNEFYNSVPFRKRLDVFWSDFCTFRKHRMTRLYYPTFTMELDNTPDWVAFSGKWGNAAHRGARLATLTLYARTRLSSTVRFSRLGALHRFSMFSRVSVNRRMVFARYFQMCTESFFLNPAIQGATGSALLSKAVLVNPRRLRSLIRLARQRKSTVHFRGLWDTTSSTHITRIWPRKARSFGGFRWSRDVRGFLRLNAQVDFDWTVPMRAYSWNDWGVPTESMDYFFAAVDDFQADAAEMRKRGTYMPIFLGRRDWH